MTIRNNGHVNPDAIYHGRGPFTTADILASRMIADPFHLLDCSMTSESGCAVVPASGTAPLISAGRRRSSSESGTTRSDLPTTTRLAGT